MTVFSEGKGSKWRQELGQESWLGCPAVTLARGEGNQNGELEAVLRMEIDFGGRIHTTWGLTG